MKKLILSITIALIGISLMAQSCIPDPFYRDSAIGVYPPPFKPERPDSGIPDSACLNEYFEFAITFKVPETVTTGGFPVSITSVEIATTGAVSNLPAGMGYACNPPTCVFVPADTLSCLVIFGTPDNPQDVGTKDVTVLATVNTNLIPIPITFPDNTGTIEGADGNYFLTVQEGGACALTNTQEWLAEIIQLRNVPNPFSDETMIEIASSENKNLTFEVFGILGDRIYQKNINIIEGINQIPFDGTALPNGIYTYSFSNEEGRVSNKMIIQR